VTYPRVSGRRPTASVQLDIVSLAAMAAALELEPGAVRTVGDTMRSLRVAPRHAWLVRRWLRALALPGLVELDGDVYRVVRDVSASGADELEDLHTRLLIPDEVALLHRRALAFLPELLRDDLTAAKLLAPESTVLGALAGERLNLLTAELDEGCAEIVLRATLGRRQPLRVVELGCGTGRLTKALLSESPSLLEHYRFTDIAGQPLRAETLDVNEDFAVQGFRPASADVVVAGHTLHHAVNLCRTLVRVHDLLVPGGELVFTTPTSDDPVALTSTHFLHSPKPGGSVAREGEVFPSGQVWQTALRAAGFVLKTEMSVGSGSSARHHLFHAVREAA
jgi:SAM-dependent methyltransferase